MCTWRVSSAGSGRQRDTSMPEPPAWTVTVITGRDSSFHLFYQNWGSQFSYRSPTPVICRGPGSSQQGREGPAGDARWHRVVQHFNGAPFSPKLVCDPPCLQVSSHSAHHVGRQPCRDRGWPGSPLRGPGPEAASA
ncbi:hypothetical protein HJG60_011401 [Phyllostomus discolor]|uniref:Uncharacterized protein n=1 Tax=Phyllostomus discolor TaxID=89673 RepID=A0A834E5E1_9CHIR|nr:hypothetical protein HJG60_011401 [Phyllostomus discolor]